MIVKVTDPNINIKYLLGLLNSKLISYWFAQYFGKLSRKIFPQFKINELAQFPIPNISTAHQQPIIELVDKMLSLHSELRSERERFRLLVSDNLLGVKMSDKRFDELAEFKDFLEELKKQKRPMPLNEQSEWREVFQNCKQKLTATREAIRQTDDKIDKMVYELYGLTEEEIKIIEQR
jgi:hypothetical protein